MSNKSKVKTKSYYYKEEPEQKKTFSKVKEEVKKTFAPKPKEEVKVEECPCCKANCQCCFHLSGTGKENTCKCRCHYKEGHNY